MISQHGGVAIKAPLRVFDSFNYGGGENGDINWLDYDWKGFWKMIYHANS